MTQTLTALGTADLVSPSTHTRLVEPGAERSARRGPGPHGLIRASAPDLLAVAAAASVLTAVAGSVESRVLVAVTAVALVWPLLVAWSGVHRLRAVAGTRRLRVRRVLRAGAVLGLACWILDALLVLPVDPVALLAATATLTVLSALLRLPLPLPGTAAPTMRLLVAGHAEEVEHTLEELGRRPGHALEPVGVCTLDASPAGDPALGPDGAPVVGDGLASVPDAVERTGADAVLVLPCHHVSSRSVQRLGWQLGHRGIELYVGTGLLDIAPERTAITHVNGLRLLHLRSLPRASAGRVLKEVAERIVAVLALLVLLPVLLAVAVTVRRDSPGPALFAQRRVGRDGRLFTMYKFRTMQVAAEDALAGLAEHNEGAGVLFKLRQDPRVTRVGAILRRYSVDELPQLLNVVRGEMSLVGPRPALPKEVAEYDEDPRRRLAVKPGLTGLWQVSGRSDLSWPETVRLDLRYVDNWSLRLDLWIVCRTFGAVLGRRGAY